MNLFCSKKYRKNRIAKNNKVLTTILSTILKIVFIIPLLMCQDFEWAIPFNIGTPPPPIEGSGYPMGGGGVVFTLNFPTR